MKNIAKTHEPTFFYYTIDMIKLDGVGLVDNKPSTN